MFLEITCSLIMLSKCTRLVPLILKCVIFLHLNRPRGLSSLMTVAPVLIRASKFSSWTSLRSILGGIPPLLLFLSSLPISLFFWIVFSHLNLRVLLPVQPVKPTEEMTFVILGCKNKLDWDLHDTKLSYFTIQTDVNLETQAKMWQNWDSRRAVSSNIFLSSPRYKALRRTSLSSHAHFLLHRTKRPLAVLQ